ncbi:hybrid sensor histidine kinase/response regulator, partial [Methylobacterium hispanicum]
MAHVERSTDQQGGAYALFQTAITLEGRVRSRTEALTGLMRELERSNAALVSAKEEAETANRSKTRFLAAASHDLLQPLNAARLSLSALADLPLAP